VCGNLRELFACGFGVTRKQAGQGPKTLRDDLQTFDVCDQADGAVREAVLPVLHECLVKYVDEFDVLHGATLAGWQLKAQLTRKGEGFHDWHFEGSSFFLAKRVLAWTIYLNDDYEGGELEFLYFAKRLRLAAGTS
jgi:hypothetical protein